MQKDDLKNIKGIIWDLDNTLYRFEGDFEHACHIAAARAAVKGGLGTSHGEALALSMQSYDKYGHSYMMFIEEYHIDRIQLHYDFHTFIDEKLIRKELELIALFERVPLPHVLVTHASREWAARALSYIGLKAFFPDDKIIPAEDVDFARKSESRTPFENALALLELRPGEVCVVEDLAGNLRVPYEMGMATALVHYGHAPDPLPDYIHMDFNNAIEFLECVVGSKGHPGEACIQSTPSS